MHLARTTRRLALLTAVTPALVLGGVGTAHAAANPVFKPIMSALMKTHVPLLLPSVLPKGITPPKIYAGVIDATPGAYEVEIAYAPNCHEATACHAAYVRGDRPGKGTVKLSGHKVSLAHNLTGYFQIYGCGASCGDSVLAWNEAGYHYTVGLHAGSFKPLLAIVNSAIQNGPVNS